MDATEIESKIISPQPPRLSSGLALVLGHRIRGSRKGLIEYRLRSMGHDKILQAPGGSDPGSFSPRHDSFSRRCPRVSDALRVNKDRRGPPRRRIEHEERSDMDIGLAGIDVSKAAWDMAPLPEGEPGRFQGPWRGAGRAGSDRQYHREKRCGMGKPILRLTRRLIRGKGAAAGNGNR
jgi:hypothetical protein